MAPIRLALVGLSSTAKTSWASAAHLPYLLSSRGQEKYQIVALLNSSLAAAERAKNDYSLPSTVKTYGDAASLASDSEIDMIAVATRVDTHFDAALPSVRAGKMAFVEWPVAQNAERARELASAAKEAGVRSVVGLQRRTHPVVRQVKTLIAEGRIGKVLSSEVLCATQTGSVDSLSEGLAYFLDAEVGGNYVTIYVGHLMDYIHSVLGEYTSSNIHTQLQRPIQKIQFPDNTSHETTSNVPDLVSIHGTLAPSPHVHQNASLLLSWRRGNAFPGTDALTWRIHGEKGEIFLRAPRMSLEPVEGEKQVSVEIHDFESGVVEKVLLPGWEETVRDLPPVSRAIGFVYDSFAEGREEEFGLVDLEGAVRRHVLVDGVVFAGRK